MDPAEDSLPIPQRHWAILTLMVGVALSCLDTALVNVALPRIAKDLNSSPAASIWVVNAYQLAVMISLLPLASFGDIFGYRRVYRFGLVLYTSAALISALAGSLEMLTLGRALQGLGAAGIMSVNTALIRYTYPRRQLGRGIALTSLVVSTSSAAGPTVAAAILSIASAVAVRGQRADRHRHPGAVDAPAAAHRAERPPLRPVERGIVRTDVRQPDQRHQRSWPRSGGTRRRGGVHRRRRHRVSAGAAPGSSGHAVAAD